MTERDIAGQRFGMWTALHRDESVKTGNPRWIAKCDCGVVRSVTKTNMVNGTSNSCGCVKNMSHKTPKTRHGQYGTKAYNSWRKMKDRCFNKSHCRYYLYGGRGITVCERWLVFQNFLDDMGQPPEGHTLERVNSDGDYEPGNCVWATPETQANNVRGLKKYFVDGEWRSRQQLMRLWGVGRVRAAKRAAAYPSKIVGEKE